MKTFRVQIRYHGNYADFTITAEDNAKSIEQSILDKIGKKDIKFTPNGSSTKNCHLTYEEIVHGTQSDQGSLSNQKIA
jgi:hypothetical protein